MDGFYRSIETSLLALSLLLGLGAFALSSAPVPMGQGMQLAVTLPMLSVSGTP